MNNKTEFTKQIFSIISRLKKAGVHAETNSDLRPSEEMFLVKIDMLNQTDIKVTDLINNFKLAPSTVSTVLKTLETKGYITRNKNNENGREVNVYFTPKGKARLAAAKKQHFNMVTDLITYLGDDDSKKLIELLTKTTIFFESRKKEQ